MALVVAVSAFGTIMQISTFRSGAALAAAAVAAILSSPSVSRAATFSDGGFEGTLVASFSSASPYWVPPYYVYPPGNQNATATYGPWTYTDPANSAGGGGAGLINVTPDPNAFYGASPPAGYGINQFAFVQSGGSLQQTFSATPGAGTITWLEANRPNNGGSEAYEVVLNGNVVGTFSGTFGAFTLESLNVVLLGSNTLVFQGLVTDSDRTVFLDNVAVIATTPLPAALPLFAGGLGVIGLLARRRKRKSTTLAA